jgi:hypothetical protein
MENKHKGLMHTFPTKSQRESPQIHHKKIAKKGSKNHQKGKMGETRSSLEEPHQVIYTYHEGSYKVYLASRSSIPLSKSHHEALKLVLKNPRKIGRKVTKGKLARVPRDGYHPLTTWVIWRQPKDETTPITLN